MPIEILMPALSPTMTEGNLAKWHKQEGDHVVSGDIIAEIETDKASMEIEAVEEGVLGRILVAEGAVGIAVSTPIALLLEEGEEAAALDAVSTTEPSAPVKNAPLTTPTPQAAPQTIATVEKGDRVFASPLARRMAGQAGLSLDAVTGSGPHGRIVKQDIETALAGGGAAPSAAPARAVETPGAQFYF